MRGVETIAEGARSVQLDLEPATAALHGVTYPLAPDLDGIYSPLQALLLENLAQFDSARAPIRWLRLLGVGWLVVPGRRQYAAAARGRRRADGVPGPRRSFSAFPIRRRSSSGRGRWSRRARPSKRSPWPTACRGILYEAAVTSRPVEHHAGGEVALVAAEDDRLRISVASEGGLLVVQRSFFPIIEARLGTGRQSSDPAGRISCCSESRCRRDATRFASALRSGPRRSPAV